MKVLDLFSGLGGWSKAFLERGHEVYTLDITSDFKPDFCCDIREVPIDKLKSLGPWDIILASPPCEKFSVMQIGKHWNKDNTPKTEEAKEAMEIVEETIKVIKELNPRYFIIENPVAKLRKLPFMQDFERRTVTYCQYGEPFMKPTDLWGVFPEELELRPPCKKGSPCHTPAPRGSRTGIQGNRVLKKDSKGIEWDMGKSGRMQHAWPSEGYKKVAERYGLEGFNNHQVLAAVRAIVPYELSKEVCLAAERGV